MRPVNDVEPLVVALAHHRAQRLLGDDLGEHDVVVRVGEAQALGVEAGGVRRERVAPAALIRLQRIVGRGEGHRLVLDVVGAEEVREVELGRRALLHAHGRAGKLLRGGDLEATS